jgi:hypothetical protein
VMRLDVPDTECSQPLPDDGNDPILNVEVHRPHRGTRHATQLPSRHHRRGGTRPNGLRDSIKFSNVSFYQEQHTTIGIDFLPDACRTPVR